MFLTRKTIAVTAGLALFATACANFSGADKLVGQNISAAYAKFGPAGSTSKDGFYTVHHWSGRDLEAHEVFVQTGTEYAGQQIVGMQNNIGGSQSPIIQDQYRPVGYNETQYTELACDLSYTTDETNVIVDCDLVGNMCASFLRSLS